ncbi:MAG: 50S ribosomal protein L15 [Candidatus Hecatellales archaeon]|nr:MAG: 50S ribosomal protein L15 [Candidatus Hecatellales archaeon]
MPHRLRKTRWHRASRTCGWGRVGQHRKSGSRGGFGKAGLHKHKWTWTVKYAPNHFGKHGFRCPTSREVKAINVGRLSELVEDLLAAGRLKPGEGGRVEVNLSELGFSKLLGGGKISRPLLVRAEAFTEEAERKIVEAGGQLVKAGG